MFRRTLTCVLPALFASGALLAADARSGPVIDAHGEVYAVPRAVKTGDPAEGLSAVFDVKVGSEDPQDLNIRIETVARYLNMHARAGYPRDRTRATLVLHGTAARDALSNAGYRKRFDTDNPNLALLAELRKAGVEIYLCGQSAAYRGFDRKELAPSVEMALSAMTVLVQRQSKGYALIAF